MAGVFWWCVCVGGVFLRLCTSPGVWRVVATARSTRKPGHSTPPPAAQVLRELGLSEKKLQQSLIEVWNKADLLARPPGEVQQPPGQPAGAGEGPQAAAEAQQTQQGPARLQGEEQKEQQQQALPHLGFIRQLLDAHAAAVAEAEAAKAAGGRPRARRRRAGGAAGGPDAPPLDALGAAELLREVVLEAATEAGGSGDAQSGHSAQRVLPTAVMTSITEGAGLPQLLLEMEKKVGECADCVCWVGGWIALLAGWVGGLLQRVGCWMGVATEGWQVQVSERGGDTSCCVSLAPASGVPLVGKHLLGAGLSLFPGFGLALGLQLSGCSRLDMLQPEAGSLPPTGVPRLLRCPAAAVQPAACHRLGIHRAAGAHTDEPYRRIGGGVRAGGYALPRLWVVHLFWAPQLPPLPLFSHPTPVLFGFMTQHHPSLRNTPRRARLLLRRLPSRWVCPSSAP